MGKSRCKPGRFRPPSFIEIFLIYYAPMSSLRFQIFSFLLILTLFFNSGCREWDKLSDEEKVTLDSILEHWKTWVPDRQKAGTAPMIELEELYQGLNADQKVFLDRMRQIDPREAYGFHGQYLGNRTEGVHFLKIEDQTFVKNGKTETVNPQYLPDYVYAAYMKMMDAMQKDIGKRLLIESGYRAAGYQLYTFLFYTPKHNYSLKETAQWVAFPGYSEHGAPQKQAVDFINQEGINGEDNAEEFERLPEYAWLQKRAHEFGFKLSYPRGLAYITFEPWHWHYSQPQE